ncbi:helix-turn-helix transcriptional regulator [Bradyrhizobium sp. 195]|nr:AlpA family phage regulatory protein [Bradyrhizobium sp. 195]
MKSGRFPAPVKLGPRITAWRDSDIQQLIQEGIPRVAIAPGNGDAS